MTHGCSLRKITPHVWWREKHPHTPSYQMHICQASEHMLYPPPQESERCQQTSLCDLTLSRNHHMTSTKKVLTPLPTPHSPTRIPGFSLPSFSAVLRATMIPAGPMLP